MVCEPINVEKLTPLEQKRSTEILFPGFNCLLSALISSKSKTKDFFMLFELFSKISRVTVCD
jgi:hypothetical protein